jgi:hypothetical protein
MALNAQHGQALVESLVALALIAGLATAVISLGRLQWHGLEASNTARMQAFRYVVGDREAVAASLNVVRSPHAAAFTAPGGPQAAGLRRELGVEDRGMVTARARVAVPLHRQYGDRMILSRHTAILADAGHASDDGQAQRRIAASHVAWGQAARASVAAARQTRARLRDMDAGWARAVPDIDWLTPWDDLVPVDRLDRVGSGKRSRKGSDR